MCVQALVSSGTAAGARLVRPSLAKQRSSGDAGAGNKGEDQEERALWQQGSDALGADAAGDAAERRGSRHPCHQPLGRMRVESLVEERPERRDSYRPEHARWRYEEHRGGARRPAEERPLDQEQQRARRRGRRERLVWVRSA